MVSKQMAEISERIEALVASGAEEVFVYMSPELYDAFGPVIRGSQGQTIAQSVDAEADVEVQRSRRPGLEWFATARFFGSRRVF